MSFQISGLGFGQFAPLLGVRGRAAARPQRPPGQSPTAIPGFPCRVSLVDAQPGERVLLVNYEHLRS